ncbi:alkyl sulfatase dimerization domain-containing protein [Shewanella algicola]|uniref:alkyl sulfatase dimerization domain-containing protein n=1 Tax=Shewanella algicola TaxID=640633 RepID=UPI0024952AF7|nr:alkyl sulfatase dimerization domain-containing protein [Shewanella algicola]
MKKNLLAVAIGLVSLTANAQQHNHFTLGETLQVNGHSHVEVKHDDDSIAGYIAATQVHNHDTRGYPKDLDVFIAGSPENALVKVDFKSGTHAKDNYKVLKDLKSTVNLPEVIWSADYNIFESEDEAKLRNSNIQASDSVHPELKRMHGIMKPTIYKLSDRVYQIYGFEMTNSTIVVGDTGLIAFDTHYSNEIAEVAIEKFREATGIDLPFHTIIYSHHHPDQLSGTGAYVTPEQVTAGEINVIAHEKLFEMFALESGFLSPLMSHRGMYAFGAPLEAGAEGYVGQGIGYVPKEVYDPRTTFTAKPNITIDDQQIMVIDGVELELFHVPGESSDHIAIYMPENGEMLLGDSIQGETIPNVYTIRGAQYRDMEEWKDSVDRMRSYHAKSFTNHHGRPVTGEDYVESVFSVWRDSLQYQYDETIRLMNKGMTRDEIELHITLPEHINDHEYHRPLRGSVEQNVRNIYNGYMGWYQGDPTEFAKPNFEDRAELYVEALGGRDNIYETAEKAFKAGNYGWTMDITTWAVRANPEDQQMKQLKADAMKQWGYSQSTPGWRNWALTGAMELENGAFVMSDMMINLSENTMDEMEMDDLFKILRTRLNSEKLSSTPEDTLLTNVILDGVDYTFGIRSGVMVHELGHSAGNLPKVISRKAFYDLFFFNTLTTEEPVLKVLIEHIESPYGKQVPIVTR